jgi:hypothetical protein
VKVLPSALNARVVEIENSLCDESQRSKIEGSQARATLDAPSASLVIRAKSREGRKERALESESEESLVS